MSEHQITSLLSPFDAVGLFTFRFNNNKEYVGTGALLNSQYILTCSHNLVKKSQNGSYATSGYFAPGYIAAPAIPLLTCQIDVGIFSERYRNGDDAWDVGVCRLQQPLTGENTPQRYFIPVIAGDEIVERFINVTGYPGNHGEEMWNDRDQVVSIFPDPQHNTIVYTNSTYEGSSGSPIWNYNRDNDRVDQYGIHVQRQAQELRRGVLITQVILDWINAAIRLLNTVPTNPDSFLYQM